METAVDGVVVDIEWEGAAPAGPVLGGRRVTFGFVDDSEMVLSAGVAPGAVPGEWYQVAPLAWCWEVDRAALRDPKAPYTPAPEGQPAEPWMSAASWPQLVLTNEVALGDGRQMPGASAFVVTKGTGTVLATALHLMGPSGGIDPAVPLSRLDQEILSWDAFVRTRRQPSLRAKGVAMTTRDENAANDWLFLHLPSEPQRVATPLRLRDTPVQPGERVWLVGCEYSDSACKQRVIGGRVSGRRRNDFRYDLDEPVELAGFSGAPILDARGLVAGMMSVGFTPYMLGDAYLEGGARDASLALPLVATP